MKDSQAKTIIPCSRSLFIFSYDLIEQNPFISQCFSSKLLMLNITYSLKFMCKVSIDITRRPSLTKKKNIYIMLRETSVKASLSISCLLIMLALCSQTFNPQNCGNKHLLFLSHPVYILLQPPTELRHSPHIKYPT